jgi:ribosomal protein L34E
LIAGIKRSVAAYPTGLQKRESTDIKNRAKNAAKLKDVGIKSQCLKDIKHGRAPEIDPISAHDLRPGRRYSNTCHQQMRAAVKTNFKKEPRRTKIERPAPHLRAFDGKSNKLTFEIIGRLNVRPSMIPFLNV